MTEHPEHEKLTSVAEMSQLLGEFLEWLELRGMSIWEYGEIKPDSFITPLEGLRRVRRTREELLADYYGIDLVKLAAEKDAMLAELRKEADDD